MSKLKPRTRIVCDACGQETDRIVLRLYKARKRDIGRTDAINYTHRANIGTCCVLRVNEIAWRPREPRKKPDVAV